MIHVYVVSGVRLYREGLCESLERREGVEVIGAAADVAAGAVAIRRLASPPDVVLLDIGEPARVEAARQLLDVLPASRVLAISVPDNELDVIACAETGVSGFLTIESSIDDLVAALESAGRGDLLCSPAMAAALLRRVSALARGRESSDPAEALTLRELEIVRLIDEGHSNKQIAQRLCIELSTVKNHVHHILGKLGVQRRSEAAARVRTRIPSARPRGLVPPSPSD
jgi:two-component system, NarL family, nitrate/nitrite response regulator NarL